MPRCYCGQYVIDRDGISCKENKASPHLFVCKTCMCQEIWFEQARGLEWFSRLIDVHWDTLCADSVKALVVPLCPVKSPAGHGALICSGWNNHTTVTGCLCLETGLVSDSTETLQGLKRGFCEGFMIFCPCVGTDLKSTSNIKMNQPTLACD